MQSKSSSSKRPAELNSVNELPFPRASKRRKSNNGGIVPKTIVNHNGQSSVVSNQGTTIAHYLSDGQKSRTLVHMLQSTTGLPSSLSPAALRAITRQHGLSLTSKKSDRLIHDLRMHSCTWSCIVHTSDAQAAGQLIVAASSTLSNDHSRNHRRAMATSTKLQLLVDDEEFWAKSWPQIEPEESLQQIRREHRSQTTAAALLRKGCSFCNRNELLKDLKIWNLADLDISILETAVNHLRAHYNQFRIQSHSLHDGQYHTCPTCTRCIKGRRFFKIPLYSWANGCWFGDIPPELSCLSYAEELVIARAHTTKCWAKINAGTSLSVLRQRAASGNVCIHPHEISTLATVLPRPMSALYDEIVIIFVSEDQEATAEMFKGTPFLVRRGNILRALNWLKNNNPLYHDIEIDMNALAEYPDDDGHVPFPVQYQHENATIRGQNATYTGHGIDTTEAIFAETDAEGEIPLSVTGTFDVENCETNLNRRKIDALRQLKAGASFAKTSTKFETLSTRHSPNVYGMLWPTLFPYGVGMFDDPVRLRKESGFKPIMLKSHVQHYLKLADRRFQTHLTFPFAMHNIQMVRKSSHQSRLAVRRAWWPKAMSAMSKIDDETLANLTATMTAKKARKDYSKYIPTSPAESSVFELLRYVDYVSDHIEGSSSEVLKMREEIQAITRSTGTVNLFFTLNPADTYNPLSAFTAGNNIDIDAIFGNPDSSFTSFQRARSLAANPIAAAEFFKLMVDQFIDTFLGFQRACKHGVFGRVKHYYGVFEAQNRGSLHMHILIWLEGALSPKLIQEKALADDLFKQRLFDWLESIIKHDLPPNTHSVASASKADKKKCLMSRPPHPDDPDFAITWPQFLREVLDASSQVHDHNETCYKKTPFSMATLDLQERDRLCRFHYPLDLVPESVMDENGKISLKRDNGRVVGYNPTLSGSFQCNTDLKFIGSGPLAMAMSIYVTLYSAKSDITSAVIMSALAAATKALEAHGPLSSDDERCRQLLLKTLNQINGRRELSGQQVACALLGIGNHITDAHFAVFYWSKLLSWISDEDFPPYSKHAADADSSPDIIDTATNNTETILDNIATDSALLDPDVDDHTDPSDLVDLDDSMVLLDEHATPSLNSLVYDVLFRPVELENIPMWDQFALYEKMTKSKGKKRCEENDDESDSHDSDEAQKSSEPTEFSFATGHPQITTHMLRKRKIPHIPVLSGSPIPRRDIPEQRTKYSIVMLVLFRPWNRSATSPLKSADTSWDDALSHLFTSLPDSKTKIIDHMQEQWECRLAADDFSAEYKARMANFNPANAGSHSDDLSSDLDNDLDWQLGQLAPDDEPIGPEYNNDHPEEDSTEYLETCAPRTQSATNAVIALTGAANFYHIPTPPDNLTELFSGSAVESRDHQAWIRAKAASLLIAEEKAVALARRAQEASSDTSSSLGPNLNNYSVTNRSPIQPRLTTFSEQKELARLRISRFHRGDPAAWDKLAEWKKIAVAVSDKFTLNRKQRLAFFLKIDDRMKSVTPNPDRKPFRLIIAGPGGTGKSHIYDALKAFYDEIGSLRELNFTAPTGVSASNIHGTTVHQELALRTKYPDLTKNNSKPLKALTARLESTRTLIIDEFFFLGCDDFEKVSRHINLARGCTDDPFGNLDLILSGDEYQLTGPRAIPLFDHNYISLHSNTSHLQALNAGVRQKLTAIKNYWTIDNCVVLDEVVRQRHPRFVDLLNRLRRGMCTVAGEDNDLDFLKQFQLGKTGSLVDPQFSDILRWTKSPTLGAPLITYTNHVRNTHNWLMTQSFAAATNQEFAVYYSHDTVGRGHHKTVLTGQNAQDAWNTPIKACADDLSGRLPLAIGMPVYVVDNIAVELGVSNGSGGTLVNIDYEIRDGRRYAISAEVDLPLYTSPDPNAEHPHRLVITPISKSIHFTKRGGTKVYTATRHQLPIIGGFSFTAHNSQSRSLNAAAIHLESCLTIAASYVMLSRIRCGENELDGLAILGNIDAKKISTHAPQEVRNEEKRLKELAKGTLAKAKDDMQWYLQLTGDSFD